MKSFADHLKDASEELPKKTELEIEKETAYKWAARAVVAAKLGKVRDAENYEHEALEHASLCKDDGHTVGVIQKLIRKS